MSSDLILASRSPQRYALLEALGLEFQVIHPETEEETDGEPRDVVERNARAKAEAVAKRHPDGIVIAGDTEVVVRTEVLGQPADEAEAREHLELLSGAEHRVLGGLAVVADGETKSGVDVTTVAFREISPQLLEAYLASGEWKGRAGSYAIQGLGSAFIDIVRGDVSNVIGLPVGLLLRLTPELVTN